MVSGQAETLGVHSLPVDVRLRDAGAGTGGGAARRSESTRLVPQRVSLSRETCVPWTWQIRVETPALL